MERFLLLLPFLSGLALGALPLARILPPSRPFQIGGEIMRGALAVLAGSLLSPASLAPLLSILAAVYGAWAFSRQKHHSTAETAPPSAEPATGANSIIWILLGALIVADPLLALSWAALALAIQPLSRRPGIGPAIAGFLLPLRFLDLASLPSLGVGAALWILLLAAAFPLPRRAPSET